MFYLSSTSENEYNSLLGKHNLTISEIYKLSQYPCTSLTSCFKDYCYREKVQILEDNNIFYLLNAVNLIFGFAPKSDQEVFNRNLTKEPLRTAVFLASRKSDPKERFSTFVCTACEILLSNGGKSGLFNDPIDVKLYGKMPFRLLGVSQKIADDWYKTFVEQKLTVAKLAIESVGEENAYAIILRSIIYSIYFFAPYKYNIANCRDEDEALHLILKQFITKFKNI